MLLLYLLLTTCNQSPGARACLHYQGPPGVEVVENLGLLPANRMIDAQQVCLLLLLNHLCRQTFVLGVHVYTLFLRTVVHIYYYTINRVLALRFRDV